VRVLIEAYLPVELKTLLEGTEIKTARDMGWQRLDNGQLLNKADGRFDVLVTLDKAMPSQQILARYIITVEGLGKSTGSRKDRTSDTKHYAIFRFNSPRSLSCPTLRQAGRTQRFSLQS
jgi:hypothetical protein